LSPFYNLALAKRKIKAYLKPFFDNNSSNSSFSFINVYSGSLIVCGNMEGLIAVKQPNPQAKAQ